MKVELSMLAVTVLGFLLALWMVLQSGADPNRALETLSRFFQMFKDTGKKD